MIYKISLYFIFYTLNNLQFRINNKFINSKYYLFIKKFIKKFSNITLIHFILFLSLSFILLKKKLNNFVY